MLIGIASLVWVQVNGWIDEQEKFVDEKTGAQRQLPKSKPLVITAGVLEEHKASLERSCNPIVNKAKPVAPPPAATPAAAETKEETPAPAGEAPVPPSSGDLD